MEALSGELISIVDFLAEAVPRTLFFTDLCHVFQREPLKWVVYQSLLTPGTPAKIKVTLALEPINDRLANTFELFAAHSVFRSLLSKRLCRIIYLRLLFSLERQSAKAFFALTVVASLSYWGNIMGDALDIVNVVLGICRGADCNGPLYS